MRYINKGGDFCGKGNEAATSASVAKFDLHKPKVRILQKENERCMEPLQFYLTVCLMLGLYWMAGALLLPLLAEVEKLSPSARLFLRLVLGFFGTTVLVALYYTSGYTVMALTLPVFGVILWLRRKEIRRISTKDFGIEWKAAAEVLAAAALLVLVQLYRNDYFNAEVVSVGYYDFGIYATVAEYLKISGIETSSPWYQLFAESADGLAKPYHYGDLWSLALLFDLSPAAPIDNYIYVWIPLINAVLFSGFTAVFRMVSGRQGWLGLVVAFMALFLNMYMEVWDWSWAFEWNLLNCPKICAFPLGLTIWLVARYYSVKYMDIFALILILVFNIVATPILALTFSICYIYRNLVFKQNARIVSLAAIGIAAITIWTLYHLIGTWQISSVTAESEQSYLYRLIKFFVASQIKYYLFFLPIMIAASWIYQHYKRDKTATEAITLLLIIALSASMVYALMNNNREYFQFIFPHITTIQLLTIIAIALSIRWIKESGYSGAMRKFALALALLQLLIGSGIGIFIGDSRESCYANEFNHNAVKLLSGTNTLGVSIHNPNIFEGFSADPRMCYACNFLKKIGPGYWANQISIPEDMTKLEFPERRTAIELSPFYRFNEQYKREAPDYTFEKAQTAFINKHEVDFIVIEKGARHPAWLAGCADTLLTDPVSGTILATLRRPCFVEPNTPTQ